MPSLSSIFAPAHWLEYPSKWQDYGMFCLCRDPMLWMCCVALTSPYMRYPSQLDLNLCWRAMQHLRCVREIQIKIHHFDLKSILSIVLRSTAPFIPQNAYQTIVIPLSADWITLSKLIHMAFGSISTYPGREQISSTCEKCAESRIPLHNTPLYSNLITGRS